MHQCVIWLPNFSVTISHLNEEMGSNYSKDTILSWDAEKSAKESECWAKITLTWSPHARQFNRSTHTEALQQNQIRVQEAMPQNSTYWILPAERSASWQTRRVGALFRECKKEGKRASIIYQTENCKADCSLLPFSKVQVVSTEA